MNFRFNFVSDYHQFYLYDKGSPGRTDSENFWNEDANRDRLAVEDGIIGVVIDNDDNNVDAEIDILTVANTNFNFEEYNHVVEASLNIKSGKLQILDCPNFSQELEIEVDPAEYRIRIYTSNFDYGIGEGKDFYKIEIWKEKYSDRKVLKKE